MNGKLDKMGMALSIGCAIHCMLMPIIIPMLPAIGFVFGHDSKFHIILAFIIISVAGIALLFGYQKHKVNKPLIYASIGCVLSLTTGIVEHYLEHIMITVITILGSMFVAFAHYLNHKYLCRCKHHGGHVCH